MATSFCLFLATIYNQSQLAERKHVARYRLINTASTAVPLSAHPSPLVITTKLGAAILGGPLFEGGVLPAQHCPCGYICMKLYLWINLNLTSHNVEFKCVIFSGNGIIHIGLVTTLFYFL